MNELLRINNLKTHFFTHEGQIPAVNGVSLSIDRGKTLGIVGESGCGKSVTAMSIMQLIPDPPGKIIGGEIFFKDQNLLKLNAKEMRKIRGGKISMIFQEPMTSLDPVFTIGHEIMEAIQLHQNVTRAEAKIRAIIALQSVGMPDAEKRIKCYPHQLSGGMRQRVMIAMALSCNPELLIADEPTTALDVTIQAQILKLINELQKKQGMAVLLITHDLGVVAEVCDYVAVMYAGHIIEYADVFTLFKKPLHPYTKGLKRSIPKLYEEKDYLDTIKGTVPSLFEIPTGCPFHPRCEHVVDKCLEERPPLEAKEKDHLVSCHLYEGEKASA